MDDGRIITRDGSLKLIYKMSEALNAFLRSANGDLLPDLIGVNSANGELTTWLSKSGVPG